MIYTNVDVLPQSSERPATSPAFRQIWMREASAQPGMILDVLPRPEISLPQRRQS